MSDLSIKKSSGDRADLTFASSGNSLRRRAGLFYYPIRALFRSVALTQHREIKAIGLENIPPDGAVFLVGNHPNSFLDFFNLLSVIRHPIATAAKETITAQPFIGPLLRKHALMIPLARAQDRDESSFSEEERRRLNERMLDEAVCAIEGGRLFNIFAEGRSTDSRRLDKIKLGFIHLALMAEKRNNFKLNLRIVPFGFYYDKINHFQSSVCIIFGKPYKLKSLVELPPDYNSLSEMEQRGLEKKILLEGKRKLKEEIEEVIISIHDEKLIGLIDEISELYLHTPEKYMGNYQNVFEKYSLNKQIAESIQFAARSDDGLTAISFLKRRLSEYRKKLQVTGINDLQVRKLYSRSAFTLHLKSLLRGLFYSPLILFGVISNVIPYQAGRLMRYIVINVQKRAQVDGDEQAIFAAFGATLLVYPLQALGVYFLLSTYNLEIVSYFQNNPGWGHFLTVTPFGLKVATTLVSFYSIYLMARLWRFALSHGGRFNEAFYFMVDALREPFRRKRMRRMRELRARIIAAMDEIIGDYS